MQCPSCGTENSARVKFCAECGSPIGVPCPDCSFRNARDAVVCGSCGRPLNVEQPREAERRQLTVFFADIVGSTALAEKLDPEDLRELFARYQALCAEAVKRFDGYIAQYLGDGILAYFGYPSAHEDDAGRATRTGLELLGRTSQMTVGGIRPSLRIGIHTGLVVVGDVGAAGRREQLALGEAPNIAARLQAEAAADTLVISDATRELLAGQFALANLGSRTLKGISRPMQIFRVLGESSASRFQAMKSTHGLAPFVGRRHELEYIQKAWSDAAQGHGSSLLLRGEAGMGKSRLLEAAQQAATNRLHEVFAAQCSPYRMNSPLSPIAEMLERRLGINEKKSDADRLDLLEQFAAGRGVDVEMATTALASLFSIPTQGRYAEIDLPPAKRLQITIGILADLLLHSVNGAPVLLLVEDLHWADPSTLDLLGEMVARLSNLPVLMVCTTRPNFSPSWLGVPQSSEVLIEALSPEDARALISYVAGPKRLPLALVREVAARTSGIPLFIEAVIRTVMSSGLLAEFEDRYELTGPLPSGLVPATVQDSLMARIDRLGADKPVAQLAATIGRESSFELLQAVLGWPDAKLTAALQNMIGLGLVSEAGSAPSSSYTFSHALIQDAAYESLLRKTRQEFHSQIAEALVQRFPEIAETKPELLARHHEGAGNIPGATAGWMKAGQQARQRLALRECEAYLRKAIAMLQTLPDDDPNRLQPEMEAQLALGQALSETFGWASLDLETAFTRARDLCMRLGNHAGLLQALIGLSAVHLLRAELQKAWETADSVFTMALASGDPMLQIATGALACYPPYYSGDHFAVLRYAEQVLPLYNVERERSIVAIFHLPSSFACAHMRAMSLWALGHLDQAVRQWREAEAMIEAVNMPVATTIFLNYTIHAHYAQRNYEEVAKLVESAYSQAADEGFMFWASQARVFRGWAKAMNGNVEAGIADMNAAIESFHLTDSGLNLATFYLLLAEAQLQAERLDEALDSTVKGIKHATSFGERVIEPELHRQQGEIYLMRDDPAEAESSFHRAIEVARAQQARLYEARAAIPLASLFRQQGRVDEARSLLLPLSEWFQEGADNRDVRKLRKTLQSLQIEQHSHLNQEKA